MAKARTNIKKKNYVLDTNVLLHDGHALQSFDEHNLIIPLPVIEELDNIKKRQGQIGVHARETLRMLEKFRGDCMDLTQGVSRNDDGGTVKVVPIKFNTETDLVNEYSIDESIKDNLIILTVIKVTKENPAVETIFVSNDLAARIKASTLGIRAEEFKDSKVKVERNYTGYNKEIIYDTVKDEVDEEKDELVQQLLDLNGTNTFSISALPDDLMLEQNEFIHVLEKKKNDKGKVKKRTTIGRRKGSEITKMRSGITVYGNVSSRNKEQALALDLLMDDDVRVITLSGLAGSGKTILALASALTKVMVEKKYEKILLLKPTISVGEEIGFLPGDMKSKIMPFLKSFLDNLEFIRRRETVRTSSSQDFEALMNTGIIDIEAVSFLRGRSLNDQFIIIDECQNLSQSEVKTLVSRVGENSKITLLGDITQIDSPILNIENNGLSRVINRFKGLPFYGHVELIRSERSDIAKQAAKLL